MSLPITQNHDQTRPLAEFVERHDVLRMLMEWITDRFAEAPDVDDSIAWEDGEEHDEPQGPATL